MQVTGFILLLGVLAIVVQHTRKEKDIFSIIAILIIIAMLIIDVLPLQLKAFLLSIGFARPLDAFMVMLAGIAVLIGLKLHVEQRKMKKQITKIVKKVALDK